MRKLGEGVTGVGALRRVLERLRSEVDQHKSQGLTEFTLSIRQEELGIKRLDRAIPMMVEVLQQDGNEVRDVTLAGPHVANLVIRPQTSGSAAQSDPGQRPGALPSESKWRNAADRRTQDVESAVFDCMEDKIPDDSRIDGDPRIETLLSPIACVDPSSFEWEGILGLMLTPSLVLVGRRNSDQGLETRIWERYGFHRYGSKTIDGQHVVRADYEDGSNVLFLFATARESAVLADYYASC
jgi:hypothetical protein